MAFEGALREKGISKRVLKESHTRTHRAVVEKKDHSSLNYSFSVSFPFVLVLHDDSARISAPPTSRRPCVSNSSEEDFNAKS